MVVSMTIETKVAVIMVVNHHHPDIRKEIMLLFKDEDSHSVVYKREVNDQPDHAQPKSKSLTLISMDMGTH